jgi:hypothetical protein
MQKIMWKAHGFKTTTEDQKTWKINELGSSDEVRHSLFKKGEGGYRDTKGQFVGSEPRRREVASVGFRTGFLLVNTDRGLDSLLYTIVYFIPR